MVDRHAGVRTGASSRVVIVGGGAAGALVAIRLLAQADAGPAVTVVEPAAELAGGVAYSTGYPEHLLNVPAGGMSAFDDDPGHFVRYLESLDEDPGRAGEPSLARRFAPRHVYGEYLRWTLAQQPGRAALRHVRDTVRDIERDARGYGLRLASGAVLDADAVVLAIGNTPRDLPGDWLPPGMPVASAWQYDAVRAMAVDAEVGIVGSGLSMVDVVLSLAANGHRGRITVLSRHGLTPLPHAVPGVAAEGAEAVQALLPMTVRERLRALRRRVHRARSAGEPWQWVFERLRPHGIALWRSLDERQRRQFLRHGVRLWDVHRHRIAPEVADVLARLRESGQLRLIAGHVLPAGKAGEIRYRPRGSDDPAVVRVDHVVNAIGLDTSPTQRHDSLAGALLQRGLIASGPLGLGIASEGAGQVVDPHARAHDDLWLLGSPRLGDLWESIAMPEIRVQARAIADALLASAKA